MHDLLLIAIIAAVLALDDRAGWQSLAGEPVFSGLLVGLVTGDPGGGLTVGVALQLVWFSIGAARGSRRPNVVVGGVVGAAVRCIGFHTMPNYILLTPCAIFLGLLAGEAGNWVSGTTGRWRERWLEGFRLPANPAVASRNLILYSAGSALYVALVDGLMVLVSVPVALRLAAFMTAAIGKNGLHTTSIGPWMWSQALPAIAVATVAHAFATRSLGRMAALGFFLAVVAAWLL
jgi:mannose/fructose/N-acetylgalactosamine-specific phosphotransferase system component IIC